MTTVKIDKEPKWAILAPGTLLREGTKLAVQHEPGDFFNYHVHRLNQKCEVIHCYGGWMTLAAAKTHVDVIIDELMQLGIDP